MRSFLALLLCGCASASPEAVAQNESASPSRGRSETAECRSSNPHLEEAKAAFDELRYDDVQRALQVAIEGPINCKELVLEIYVLKTFVDAASGEYERCHRDFEVVLELKPDFVMTPDMPPELKHCIQ